jgi:hypothetical protein
MNLFNKVGRTGMTVQIIIINIPIIIIITII